MSFDDFFFRNGGGGCGGLLEVPQIIISVGYEAMRFAKFTVASFNFFGGGGGGRLGAFTENRNLRQNRSRENVLTSHFLIFFQNFKTSG